MLKCVDPIPAEMTVAMCHRVAWSVIADEKHCWWIGLIPVATLEFPALTIITNNRLWVIWVSIIKPLSGWKILHLPCLIITARPFSINWPRLSKLFFSSGTKNTSVMTWMIPFISMRILPRPCTLRHELFPIFTLSLKLLSNSKKNSLLPHMWLLHPESRYQMCSVATSSELVCAINNISSLVSA